MANATKRLIFRWLHIVAGIPVLGYVYGSVSQVQQYATAVRFIFVPVIVLSGFWMYAGAFFALVGVAIWVGACYLSGYGAAVLSQVVLFIVWKVWMAMRARPSK